MPLKDFCVSIPICGYAVVTVEAEDEYEAKKKALEVVTLDDMESWEALEQMNLAKHEARRELALEASEWRRIGSDAQEAVARIIGYLERDENYHRKDYDVKFLRRLLGIEEDE